MVELMNDGYVTPKSVDANGHPKARNGWDGITAKGMQHLNELKHPTRTWFSKNWFPTVIASLTTVALATNTLMQIFL